MIDRLRQASLPWPLVALLLCLLAAPGGTASAQAEEEGGRGLVVPQQVEVEPTTADAAIAARLQDILEATGRFDAVDVTVREGVVFLDGSTVEGEWQEWAASMAGNTEGVVAVVDRITVRAGDGLDFEPALTEIEDLWVDSLQALPLVAVVAFIVLITWVLAFLVLRLSRHLLRNRLHSHLLANVTAWLVTVPVIIIGLYVALRIAGLTQLALTVIGGTGLFGLVVGIAFRDIAENYLASILLSIRNPFRAGDRVEVAGSEGIVQRVTTRGTILMTLDGNHRQIPNSTVYKSIITNYTANPSRRTDFGVGIGYDASIPEAQAAIGQVLETHPAVLQDPEPLVLVEELATSTVNLRAYYWFDGTRYEGPKLTSALIRLTKRALETRGISMPDEAREVIFPQGVPVVGSPVLPAPAGAPATREPQRAGDELPAEPVSTQAEGDLRSEDGQIREQARRSRLPEAGDDLLEPSSEAPD